MSRMIERRTQTITSTAENETSSPGTEALDLLGRISDIYDVAEREQGKSQRKQSHMVRQEAISHAINHALHAILYTSGRSDIPFAHAASVVGDSIADAFGSDLPQTQKLVTGFIDSCRNMKQVAAMRMLARARRLPVAPTKVESEVVYAQLEQDEIPPYFNRWLFSSQEEFNDWFAEQELKKTAQEAKQAEKKAQREAAKEAKQAEKKAQREALQQERAQQPAKPRIVFNPPPMLPVDRSKARIRGIPPYVIRDGKLYHPTHGTMPIDYTLEGFGAMTVEELAKREEQRDRIQRERTNRVLNEFYQTPRALHYRQGVVNNKRS